MKKLVYSIIGLVQLCLAGMVTFVITDRLFPLPLMQQSQDKFSRLIVAQDGTPLRAFADRQGVWRYPVSMADVSPRYINTLLAYEDRWFWYHPGINPVSMLRAMAQNLYYGRIISGGSTLTMQVARLVDPHSRTIAGKVKQMFRALQLEWHYNKSEILTLYLNLAPFGGPLEGVQAASFAYLGKSAKELSQAEAALLSVLPQSPSRFRPDKHPDRATRARNKVLHRMQKLGYLNSEQVQDAMLEIIVPQFDASPMIAPILARRLKHKVVPGEVLHTTIDSNLQLTVEAMVKDYARQLPDKSSAAVLVVNHQNMEVKAYIASADFYDAERFGQVDMIRAVRSPGSTLKPFLYGMALDQGLLSSHSMLMDEAINIAGYQPKNFSETFSGAVSMSEALQRSLNIPAIQVLQFLGPGYFYSRLENAGLKLHLPTNSKANLSLILGGAGTRLEQLVASYTSLSREGKVAPLKFIDNVSKPQRTEEIHLMSPGAAWIIRKILSQVQFREAIATMVSQNTPLAWKTGTSYGYRDAWAIGMTDHYTIGVWTGRPDGTPVPGQYGAQTAVPLLRMVSLNLPRVAEETARKTALSKPNSVTRQEICWPNGGRRSLTAANKCSKHYWSWVLDNTIPPTLPKDPNIDTSLNDLKIISLRDGEHIQRAIGSEQALSIPLTAQGGTGARFWFVNGKAITNTPQNGTLNYIFKPTLNSTISSQDQFYISVVDVLGQMDQITISIHGW